MVLRPGARAYHEGGGEHIGIDVDARHRLRTQDVQGAQRSSQAGPLGLSKVLAMRLDGAALS